MPDPAPLEQIYRDAIYEVDLPTGTVALRVGGAAPAGLPRPLALITAWNPGAARPGRRANEAANRRLQAELVRRGLSFHTGRGRDAAGAHVEPSFAITGISRQEALAIGRSFGQAAILYCESEVVELVWCIPPTRPRA